MVGRGCRDKDSEALVCSTDQRQSFLVHYNSCSGFQDIFDAELQGSQSSCDVSARLEAKPGSSNIIVEATKLGRAE